MEQKILIVGDDRHTRDALAGALSYNGFQIFTASNGREALFQFGMAQPDLVILDIPPLDMEGWETLQRIRELSGIPIIALGAPHDPKTEIESLDRGADHFISRPFGVQELCARVRALLRRAERKPVRARGENPSPLLAN